MKNLTTSEIAKVIGNQLKITREEKHLTQEQVAKAIGCEWKDIEYWERGNMFPPSLCDLILLAEYFEVDINYFTSSVREAMESDA